MTITVRSKDGPAKKAKSIKEAAKLLMKEPQARLSIGTEPFIIPLVVPAGTFQIRRDLPGAMERLAKRVECLLNAEIWRIALSPLPDETLEAFMAQMSPEDRVECAMSTDRSFELIYPYAHALGFKPRAINRWAMDLSLACWDWLSELAESNPEIDRLVSASVTDPARIDDLVREAACLLANCGS